jgi:hypothetical protein
MDNPNKWDDIDFGEDEDSSAEDKPIGKDHLRYLPESGVKMHGKIKREHGDTGKTINGY